MERSFMPPKFRNDFEANALPNLNDAGVFVANDGDAFSGANVFADCF
jgi:hypothetical protein